MLRQNAVIGNGKHSRIKRTQVLEGCRPAAPRPLGMPCSSLTPNKHLGERRQATSITLAMLPPLRASLAEQLLLIIDAGCCVPQRKLARDSGTDASPAAGAVRLGDATSSCVTCGRNVRCACIVRIDIARSTPNDLVAINPPVAVIAPQHANRRAVFRFKVVGRRRPQGQGSGGRSRPIACGRV
jgi:hypothetical protein